MGFYSFVVHTRVEIQVPDKGLVLDPGTNAFNARVEDLDDFVSFIGASGGKVVECHKLDDFEHLPPNPEILEAMHDMKKMGNGG